MRETLFPANRPSWDSNALRNYTCINNTNDGLFCVWRFPSMTTKTYRSVSYLFLFAYHFESFKLYNKPIHSFSEMRKIFRNNISSCKVNRITKWLVLKPTTYLHYYISCIIDKIIYNARGNLIVMSAGRITFRRRHFFALT